MSGTESQSFVETYLRESAEVALRTNGEDVCRVIDLLFEAYLEGRTIYTCGNGGSAANASHLAADLAKFTWAEGKPRFRVQSLCDNAALISALTNDVGFHRIFAEQLEPVAREGDVLVCLSVHGGSGADKAGPWSQNLVSAADLMKKRGGRVVALVGYDGGALRQLADASVVVPATEEGHTSTPHVEGFHVVYHHLIAERLRQLVGAHTPRGVMGGPAGLLLDRDGTLIDVVRDEETGAVVTAFHPSHLRILPGVVEGLRAARSAGMRLALATNQPGPAKGQISREAVLRTNQALCDLLAREGAPLDAVEVCMHHPEGGPGGERALWGPCACRKPAPGMLLSLVARLGLDPARTWAAGDTAGDIEAGRRAGLRTGLVFPAGRCELCPLRGGPPAGANLTAPGLDLLVSAILRAG